MDEPSEGLAPQLIAEVRRAIAHLKHGGLSIVLVEQNLNMTFELADELVIFNTGKVVFQGAPTEARAAKNVVASISACSDGLLQVVAARGPRVVNSRVNTCR